MGSVFADKGATLRTYAVYTLDGADVCRLQAYCNQDVCNQLVVMGIDPILCKWMIVNPFS